MHHSCAQLSAPSPSPSHPTTATTVIVTAADTLPLLCSLKKPSTPGDALLSRLAKTKATQKASPTKTAGGGGGRAKPPTPSAASKAKAKTKKTGAGRGAGAAKVARAKADAGGKMDVDRPAVGNVKSQAQPQAPAQPKTQAQLDEEMRAYERARRFGA